jgi:hypothetical protein
MSAWAPSMVDLLIKLGLGRGNSSIVVSIAIKNDQKRGKLGFFMILPTRSLPIFDQNWDLEWCEWQKILSKDREVLCALRASAFRFCEFPHLTPQFSSRHLL